MHDSKLEDPPDRPNLVCLSGLLCDDEVWHPVVETLGNQVKAQVFSFPGVSSITAMAMRVLAEAPPSFAIAGHSMGGRVALEVFRLAPARVTGIALLNTGVHPPASHEPRSRGELVELARTQGMKALAARWLPPMLAHQRDPNDSLVVRLTRMIERSTPDGFAAQVNALLNRPPAGDLLGSIRVPVLLVSATADTWSPPSQHAAMQTACPGARLVVIEDAGHMSLIEQPAAVATALADWMSRVSDRLCSVHLTRMEELQIAEACRQLIYHYARLNDSGEWDALSALFTEQGTLSRPSDPDTPIKGRGGILASLQSRTRRITRHVVSNVEVIAESNSRARAVSTVVLYAGEALSGVATIASTSVGHFEDTFEKVRGRWLFSERRGHMALRSFVNDISKEGK